MRVLLTAVRNRSGRMLSAGNASASSEAKATSSGIFSWDCAYSSHQKALLLFPLESPPFSHPDWKGYLRKNYLSFHLAKELYYWRNLYQQPVYMPLHRGCQRWLQSPPLVGLPHCNRRKGEVAEKVYVDQKEARYLLHIGCFIFSSVY